MFGVDLKGIFFISKTGQRSPMFQVIVELGGRVTGSSKRAGEKQTSKTRKYNRKRKVKRVQRDCYCPGDAWQQFGRPQS